MSERRIFSQKKDRVALILILAIFGIFIPVVSAASPNDACFSGDCHDTNGPKIDQALYNSNPHKIIKCIECHSSSTSDSDPDHGMFIRQLNGSKITGPLTTKYYSQNFSLCYYCHAEEKVVGILDGWIPSSKHNDLSPIIVSSIGSNFINIDPKGYHNGSEGSSSVFDIPTNIHWNHLDAFGSTRYGEGGYFDSDMDGNLDSLQSCPACHNVHGTNYPKMTKNDIAITYSSDGNGTFGYIGSEEYKRTGGDAYCEGTCHTAGPTFSYYRTEINLFQDCVSCHVDGSPGDVNRTAFGQGVHVNINTSDGSGLVNNSDCWTCHYNKDMVRSNIWQCNDCHTGTGKDEAPLAPILSTHISGVKITNYTCVDCHSKVIVDPGTGIPNITSHYLKRPTITSENYCDYCHGPNANSPFNATNKTIPAFNHDDESWDGNATCRTCHSNSSVSADPLAGDMSSFHDLTTELGDAYNGTTKADCIICHVEKSPQFVAAPNPPHETSGEMQNCRTCHTSGSGTDPQKLHSVTAFATGGCIGCHSFEVNTTLFGKHAKINTSDDPNPNNVTDGDCKICHFGAADGSMKMRLNAANSSNTYFCNDCHVPGGRNGAQYANISVSYRKSVMPPGHGKTDCTWCHLAGASLPRQLRDDLNYHPNGPKGTAAGKNCLTCHYDSNLPYSPFHAPGENHPGETTLNDCLDACHGNVNNHYIEIILNSGTPPSVSGLSVTTPVYIGSPVQVQATVTDDMMQIAAAQYQIKKGSTIVKDWTNMTPKDGKYDKRTEIVNTSIDTSSLLGTYTVYVKGMASAPKTSGGPYYPLNGQWSGVYNTQFIVEQPEGYDNGTVYGSLGVKLAGAIVSTDTGVYTYTNETGFYSLSLVNGTYHLTASKEPEYYPNSSVSVTVTAFTTVTQDIILTAKPTGNITGNVTNK
jgi:hypothetical protein